MDGLPEYMKSVAKIIFHTFQEYERELGSESGGSYSLKATTEDVSNQIMQYPILTDFLDTISFHF